MPWTDIPAFSVGQVLKSQTMNEMRANANIGQLVCTSATRPGSPDTGTMIYETDTARVFYWTGAVWAKSVRVEAYPTGWISPPLVGAWANYGGGWVNARYMKDEMGFVHLEGLVRSGAGRIFDLPAGYRPLGWHLFSVVGGNAFARVNVSTSGVDFDVGNNGFVNLSGITFGANS